MDSLIDRFLSYRSTTSSTHVPSLADLSREVLRPLIAEDTSKEDYKALMYETDSWYAILSVKRDDTTSFLPSML
mgnify:CR=1 FL=1